MLLSQRARLRASGRSLSSSLLEYADVNNNTEPFRASPIVKYLQWDLSQLIDFAGPNHKSYSLGRIWLRCQTRDIGHYLAWISLFSVFDCLNIHRVDQIILLYAI